ncbi:DUF1036 domain-containing protein [Microcystis sp. BLCC-F210]|uniref:DUF1036 domain-containing protein n=1 Tax=Microcystis sp. BLCC-F210 TaxID=3342751 RepID=UPI0035C8C393
MNDLPRQKLCEIITEYGQDVSDNPQRCEGLLKDFCGQYSKEVFLLVNALKKGVATELLKSQNQIPQAVILSKLTKRLQDELGIAEESAYWAVDSWGLALGVISQPRTKNDFQSQQQLIVERQQQAEKEQKQREEYEKKLDQSQQEIQQWKQEVGKLNEAITTARQQQNINQKSAHKFAANFVSILAGISALAAFLLGIYAYQKNQQMGNLTENLNNLTIEYNQKTENLITEHNQKIKSLTTEHDQEVENIITEHNQKVENITNKRNLLYNQVQNFQNTLENVENNLENNLNISGDTYLNLCNQTSNDIIDAAIMYWDGDGWKSRGWWNIKKGECTKVLVDFNERGDIYIHGQINNIKWESDDFSFCATNTRFEFEKSDEMECSGDNYKVNAIKFLVFPGVNDYKFKDYKNYTE